MLRGLRLFAVLVGVPALATVAHARWFQMGGYGWGGWGGASTVGGDLAQGMGMFAEGKGLYNLKTAEADAINVNTAIQWNNFMWESQQIVNREQMERAAASRARRNQARSEIFDRLRDNPTVADINRGAALNVILDELNSPKIYLRALKAAGTRVGGEVIRKIPFQKASAAITTSIATLVQGGPPPALLTGEFNAERDTLKGLAATLREKTSGDAEVDPATLKQIREVLLGLKDKVAARYPANSRERRAADNYLKSLFGLSQMLETRAVGVLLAGVDQHPEATLGELLLFMKAFNLRFGVANQPEERQIYGNLYRQLVTLRNEAFPVGSAAPTPWDAPQPTPAAVPEVFSGVGFDDIAPAKPAPAPGH